MADRKRRGAEPIRHEPTWRAIPRGAIRVDLPNVVQKLDHACGAACLVAVGAYFGQWLSEARLVDAMGFGEGGSDPAHLIAGAEALGLHHAEHRGMTDDDLRRSLDRCRPVVMMLQAWGDRRSYADHWTDGHWVVAIGYDRRGVYFEDPMIECMRGCLAYDELAERWHDLEGVDDAPVTRYGLAVWRPRVRQSQYTRRARVLG